MRRRISPRIPIFLIAATTFFPLSIDAQDSDSADVAPLLEGTAYTEVNVGHRHHQEHPVLWDFPHIILEGQLNLKRGWMVNVALEYERKREDGSWGNNFRDNYTTNELSVTKMWRSGHSLSMGIVPVPVGVTNSGGAALTIYDPVSEAALLPMTWHETGVTFGRQWGRVAYKVAALAYLDAPLKRSRMLGGAARVCYTPAEGIALATSGYWGASTKGMIGFSRFDYMDSRRTFLASVDYNLERAGFIADGSFIYASNHDARSFGSELGYNVLHTVTSKMQLIPFARYDGVYHIEDTFNKWTVGFNFNPLSWMVLKAEYGWARSNHILNRSLDVCMGFTWEF